MNNTVTLSYTEAGQGTPLVLLHGFPLSGSIWREQRQQLAAHCRVIVPDLRGHGLSPAPSGAYSMDLLARDVLALFDKLSVKKAVILGHSMGGYVTLAASKLDPQRFLALGLVCSHGSADPDEAKQNRYKLADKVAADGAQVVAEAMLPKLFAASLPATAPIVEETRHLILNTKPAGIIGSLQGMAERPDCAEWLPSLTMPVLLLMGAQDRIIPPEKGKAMAAVIPSATLTVVENAGHMPMLEQPAATTAAIQSFLKEVRDVNPG